MIRNERLRLKGRVVSKQSFRVAFGKGIGLGSGIGTALRIPQYLRKGHSFGSFFWMYS